MEKKCKFCETERTIDLYGGAIDVDLYAYEGDVVGCCTDCLNTKVDIHEIKPINLPDGWEVVRDSAYLMEKKGNRAFKKALGFIRGIADKYKIPLGYKYDLDVLSKRIVDNLENEISVLTKRLDTLGIKHHELNDVHLYEGVLLPMDKYCPDCGGHLVYLRSVKDKHIMIDMFGREGYLRHARACLGCRIVFVGKKIE
jgi:hypothetical protein